MHKPLPETLQTLLEKNVPYYHHLPPHLQDKLQGLTNVFLDEKIFEGCAGLTITDEIRVTIAAQACILLLGVKDVTFFYDTLRSVLVYPKNYIAKVDGTRNSFFVEEGFERRHGEAWSRGHIVLAWDEVKKGSRNIHDGQNLVFHEFAHLLDYESEATEDQARVISAAYQNFLKALQNDQQTLMDEYGATNPAEFFAVATEYFFEKPLELRENHPDLYSHLTQFYHQDPASYSPG